MIEQIYNIILKSSRTYECYFIRQLESVKKYRRTSYIGGGGGGGGGWFGKFITTEKFEVTLA